jgi:hypothetical protein
VVLLFDENGEKRDKFATKPADAEVLQYLPTCIEFKNVFDLPSPPPPTSSVRGATK